MYEIQYYDQEWNQLSNYWNTYAVGIEFSDGTDALAQENGYTLEKCRQMENVRFFLD